MITLLQEATSAASILQLSIAPVTVISGVGLLLLSMTNRYGRVVDRTRSLIGEIKHANKDDSQRFIQQMQILFQRAKLLRTVIVACTSCIIAVVISIFCIFVTQVFGIHFEGIAIGSFLVGLLALMVSLILFLQDLSVSMKALHLEAERYLNKN